MPPWSYQASFFLNKSIGSIHQQKAFIPRCLHPKLLMTFGQEYSKQLRKMSDTFWYSCKKVYFNYLSNFCSDTTTEDHLKENFLMSE